MAFFAQVPAEQSIGSMFGQGFSQTLPQQLDQFFEQKKETKDIERLQEQLASLSPDATLGDRLQAVMMARSSPKTKEKFMELMKLQGATDFAKKFREGEDVTEGDLIEGMALGYIDPGYAQAKIRQLGELPKKEQSKKLAKLYGIPEDYVSALDPKAVHNFAETNRKENVETFKNITDLSYNAQKKLDDLNQLDRLLDKGAFDPTTAGNFAKIMEESNHPWLASIGRAFESGDTASAQTLIKDLFTDLVKSVPAKGVNIFVERIMRDMLPLLGRNKEANKAVSGVLRKGIQAALLPSQVRQEILAEHDGSMPWNFNALYQERLAKRSDEALNRAINEGESVIEKFGTEEDKKTPTGTRKNVYDKKTGKLLGDIDEEEVETVDTNLYIIR